MNETESNEPSPKIIVDSDWKEQVAKEKETVAADESLAEDEAPAATGDDTGESSVTEVATETAVSESRSADPEMPASTDEPTPGSQLPPASFEVLISMLFTQAIAALGQMPNPSGAETKIDKPMAKHTIDTLEMLQAKTEGNLTPEESKMIGEALHALRMTYVSVRA